MIPERMKKMNDVIPSLKEVYKDAFKIGAAVNDYVLANDKKLLKKHFNSLTAENSMKFESIQPEEGLFDFSEGDRIVRFAEENDMAVRGHTLVWHNQTPDWVFEGATKDVLLSRMKTHIETVFEHYGNRILTWDVVNEVIEDKGDTLLRESPWKNIIGDDFIDYAFRYAHEANPNVALFYNDYNESHPAKSDKIVTMVKGMIERGVPIHGVGLQGHWNITTPSLDDIKRAIEKYAALGLKLHVTEMDVSVFEHEDKRIDLKQPTASMLEKQAERYEAFFDIFKSYQDHIDSVTFWGVNDGYTWLDDFPVKNRKNWPFVFDESGEPKQSFWNLVK